MKDMQTAQGINDAEKPVNLMIDIMNAFTNPDDHVLDACTGTGAMFLACAKTKRSCVAIDFRER